MGNFFSWQGLLLKLISIPLIFACMTVHECAHGYIAYKMGDNTAKNAGRLTLNPLKHIDWFGALAMFLVGFGWAKPVPVNPYNFKKSGAKGIVWVSLAGPISNLLFGFAVLLIWYILRYTAPAVAMNTIVYGIAGGLASLNFGLAIFNLVPIPPLDGSKVMMYFLSYKARVWLEQNQNMLYMGLMLLVFTGILGRIISPVITVTFDGLNFLAQWITSPLGHLMANQWI